MCWWVAEQHFLWHFWIAMAGNSIHIVLLPSWHLNSKNRSRLKSVRSLLTWYMLYIWYLSAGCWSIGKIYGYIMTGQTVWGPEYSRFSTESSQVTLKWQRSLLNMPYAFGVYVLWMQGRIAYQAWCTTFLKWHEQKLNWLILFLFFLSCQLYCKTERRRRGGLT